MEYVEWGNYYRKFITWFKKKTGSPTKRCRDLYNRILAFFPIFGQQNHEICWFIKVIVKVLVWQGYQSARHMVKSSHDHLVTQSARHKWVLKKVSSHNYPHTRQVAARNSEQHDGVITASEQTPRHTQCRVVSGTASDLINAWLLLRPTTLAALWTTEAQ